MDRDFQIGSRKFKLNKMDPFKQFHLLRKVTPILSELIPVAQKLSKSPTGEEQFETLIPVMKGISQLPDEDATKILLTLLSSIEMQQPQGNWAFVVVGSNLMFQDLELPLMMQMAGRAFAYNLQGFLAGLPQVSGARG